MPQPEPPNDQAADIASRRALASLGETAEQWAEQTNLTATVAAIANVDDRESRIEALMKLAFVEGAYHLFCQAKDDGILDTGLPDLRADEPRYADMHAALTEIMNDPRAGAWAQMRARCGLAVDL